MGSAFCIGAMDLAAGGSLRLRPDAARHGFPEAECPYEVGSVYDLAILPVASLARPHVEDVVVRRATFVGRHPDLRGFIEARAEISSGPPEVAFDGLLQAENEKGFYDETGRPPAASTCFWRPAADLADWGDCYHYEGDARIRRIAYVGYARKAPFVPAGSLVRLSLARPFSSPWYSGRRGYLQLSGWY
jgi:hypothetical protein